MCTGEDYDNASLIVLCYTASVVYFVDGTSFVVEVVFDIIFFVPFSVVSVGSNLYLGCLCRRKNIEHFNRHLALSTVQNSYIAVQLYQTQASLISSLIANISQVLRHPTYCGFLSQL